MFSLNKNISNIYSNSICSCVLFVGLDSNSRRFDFVAVDTSVVLVINDTKSLKQTRAYLSISHLDHRCVLEYVGTDNPVFVFQANLDFILQQNTLLIHDIEK